MEAKEKAKELVDKYKSIVCYDGYQAKQCALICVDEIIEATKIKTYNWIPNTLEIGFKYSKYWQEVKQEINKL